MKFALLFLCFLAANAFPQGLSIESQNIKTAYEQLKEHPEVKRVQLRYLHKFPNNKKQFLRIFNPDNLGQLYSGSYKYISLFIELAKKYPNEVMDKAIRIGCELKWDADAVGYLQRSIVDLGNEHVKMFSDKLNYLPERQKNGLITFLADVENHKAYHDYQLLIDALTKTNQTKLAEQFIKARAVREKVKNH